MIILTGFGPYDKNTINLSGEIVKNLELSNLDFPLVKKVLPVIWDLSLNYLKNLLTQANSNPKLVILLGIHESRKFLIEKYGWNFAFGKDIKSKFKLGLIQYRSPLILKSILNINKLYSSLQLQDEINISISNYPGMYLCNYIYYWALLLSEKKYPVVFIHIPYKIKLNIGIEIIEKLINTIISTHNTMI
ncbi:MAG: pyroglutamyl-peptidase I family protein [Promethearchaeota archaeon]